MASLQTSSSRSHSLSHDGRGLDREETRIHTRGMVKPILKKLRNSTPHSYDKKNSLDLDRGWDEQAGYGVLESHYYYDDAEKKNDDDRNSGFRMSGLGGGYGASLSSSSGVGAVGRSSDMGLISLDGPGSSSRSARDVSFSFPPIEHGGAVRKSNLSKSGGGAFTGFFTSAASGNGPSSRYPASPSQANFTSSSRSHTRSTSGASHASAATSISGRNGSFIHPFQQTPRTSTPPLSYSNSVSSLDNYFSAAAISATASAGATARDHQYPPSIIENEDDDNNDLGFDEFADTTRTSIGTYRNSLSDLRRPSLTRQRATSATTDKPPSLHPPFYSSLGARSNSGRKLKSQLSQQLQPRRSGSLKNSGILSSLSSAASSGRRSLDFVPTATSTATASPILASPLSTVTAEAASSSTILETPLTSLTSETEPIADLPRMQHKLSHGSHTPYQQTLSHTDTCNSASSVTAPIRNSLDMGAFRLRSRSEVDTASRQEQIREARRKFEEKERAKSEKRIQHQQRKERKAANREAARVLGMDDKKTCSQGRKSSKSSPTSSSDLVRRSTSIDQHHRPTPLTKSDKYSTWGPDTMARWNMADVDESVEPEPTADGVRFETTRQNSRRRKNGGYQGFMFWLRVKLLHAGRR